VFLFLIRYYSEPRLASHSRYSPYKGPDLIKTALCSEILIKIPSIQLCGNYFGTFRGFLFEGEKGTADSVRLMYDFLHKYHYVTSIFHRFQVNVFPQTSHVVMNPINLPALWKVENTHRFSKCKVLLRNNLIPRINDCVLTIRSN